MVVASIVTVQHEGGGRRLPACGGKAAPPAATGLICAVQVM